jgi:uncharacterized membrane protein YkvA (DUF1232 family)
MDTSTTDETTKAEQDASVKSHHQKKLEQELYQRAARVSPSEARQVEHAAAEKFTKLLNSANHGSSLIRKLLNNVKTLLMMLRDKKFSMEWQSKAIIIAALGYFITPTDLFPDFIPFVGYLDDAFILSLVFNVLNEEISRFERYAEHLKSGKKQ